MDIDVTIGNDVTMKGGALAGLGRIDQYELVRELGGGGFGCVYLAKDTVAGIEVAVKGLPPEVKHNKEELENIRENFALVSRLHHPNIAAALVLHPAKETVYSSRDVMEKLRVFEGDTLMVMEYAPGSTLSSWRKQFPERRVPFDVAVDIVRQIASALDYAHERKIVHRDIKPANVMIEMVEGGGNAVRILDFGLAAEIRSSMGRVSREIRDMSGTRPYMAPEQWAGEKQGAATDQYALAVLFCELVSGAVPYQSAFESGDSVVMMANVIHQPVKLPEHVPEKVRAPILRALSKKPSGRYPTCTAFAEALTHRSFRWPQLVIGLLILAVCAAAGWRFLREEPQPKPSVVLPDLPLDVKPAPAPVVSVKPALAPVIAENSAPVQTNPPPAVAKPVVAKVDAKSAGEQEGRKKQEAELRQKWEAELKLKQETEQRQKQAEELRRREQEAELKRKQEEELRRKQEEELRRKQEEELRRKKAEEELRRKQKEKLDAELKARQELLQRLRTASEFVPDPPATAAGTERRIALPNGGCMDFVWCPPGRFLMGSPETEDKRSVDEKQHVVTLARGFWIGKTEVTRTQWKSVMGDAGFAFSSLWGGDGEFPIDTVSWHQCQEFCRKAGNGFRLPTEAEWEYACRAGAMTPFSFGTSLNGDKANCSGGAEPYGTLASGPNSFGSKRVANYQRNPWGIYDMHGNLFEWCSDYYAEYPADDSTDPKGPETGSTRVVRGGCWNFAPKMCRSAFRSRKDPVSADAHTGFRVCCDRLP